MSDGLMRGDNRNDSMAEAVMTDPGVQAAVAAHHDDLYDRMQDAIGDAIDKTDSRTLKGWIAVAVWEDEEGTEGETMMSDNHSSPLELKAYLHDAVWMAAHAE